MRRRHSAPVQLEHCTTTSNQRPGSPQSVRKSTTSALESTPPAHTPTPAQRSHQQASTGHTAARVLQVLSAGCARARRPPTEHYRSVPHSPEHLNDKQVRVLAWVAQGRPDGTFPPDSYAHRITARALETRGWLRLSGKGAGWSATLTDEGRARLGAERARTRNQEQSLTAGAQLIADVLAAGGSLDVTDCASPRTAWDSLIRNANQSKARPYGKMLVRATGSRGGSVTLRFKANYWDTTDRPDVAVPARPRALHPAVEHYAGDGDWHYVTQPHLRRAINLLEGIARTAEQLGMSVQPGTPWWNPPQTWQQSRQTASHLKIEHRDRGYRLVIRELKGEGSVRRDPSASIKKRLPRWLALQHYTFVSTGRIAIELAGPGMSDFVLKDTRSQTLESQLGRILQAVQVGSLEADERDQHVAERERAKQQEWQAAMEQARADWERSQRLRTLDERATAWERRQRIALYVDAASTDPNIDANGIKWLAWAREWLRANEVPQSLEAFDLPAPSPSELQRHLSGWSAYGPAASSSQHFRPQSGG